MLDALSHRTPGTLTNANKQTRRWQFLASKPTVQNSLPTNQTFKIPFKQTNSHKSQTTTNHDVAVVGHLPHTENTFEQTFTSKASIRNSPQTRQAPAEPSHYKPWRRCRCRGCWRPRSRWRRRPSRAASPRTPATARSRSRPCPRPGCPPCAPTLRGERREGLGGRQGKGLGGLEKNVAVIPIQTRI